MLQLKSPRKESSVRGWLNAVVRCAVCVLWFIHLPHLFGPPQTTSIAKRFRPSRTLSQWGMSLVWTVWQKRNLPSATQEIPFDHRWYTHIVPKCVFASAKWWDGILWDTRTQRKFNLTFFFLEPSSVSSPGRPDPDWYPVAEKAVSPVIPCPLDEGW